MIILTDMNAASNGGRGEGGCHPQAKLCAGDKDAGERGTLESGGGGCLQAGQAWRRPLVSLEKVES